MEALYKLFSGVTAALVGLFAPLAPLVTVTVLFIAIDFVLGVVADRAMARREGRAWYFESHRARQTVTKAALVLIALAMAHLLDQCVLEFMHLKLAHLFAGFTCGVELWSFMENAAQLSDAPLFQWMRRYLHRRIEEQLEQ